MVAFSIKVFCLCLYFPSLVGLQLTCFLKLWQQFSQFSPVCCTSLDHRMQVAQAQMFFCFGGLKIMSSCLSARHIYWWSNMCRNNSSLFGFWSLILGEDPQLWNLAEGSTFLQSWACLLLAGSDLTFDTSYWWAQIIHWWLIDLWESQVEAGQAQARCRQSPDGQATLGPQQAAMFLKITPSITEYSNPRPWIPPLRV